MTINRIEAVRSYMLEVLDNCESAEVKNRGYIHINTASTLAGIIAKKRGLDAELAQIAGLLHDLAYYKTLERQDHSALGSVLAKDVLCRMSLTDDEENHIICDAIFHHSDKYDVHSEYDELLKDADALAHVAENFTKPIKNSDRARYKKVSEELGLKQP